ncbi:MAG TPA: bifunctional phosphopantothenoylcysteine decarboxylase/phosphopantothenate--cysteine ligase CoaBC, partial [Candidatus Manganitrophaceae bacterium]
LFDPHDEVVHLTLAEDADLILIAPATANFIAKMATGLADDLLSNLLLAAAAPVFLAPAMDIGMWEHPAVQKNISILRERGVGIIEPEVGPLASGKEGKGRLADGKIILEKIRAFLTNGDLLAGAVVLVTAGPTQEEIDPVRYISNRSSGKMGYALAKIARRWGAKVVLISGHTSLDAPPGVERIPVRSAEEMKKEVELRYPQATAVIMAAAVSDYRPRKSARQKLKKTGRSRTLDLEETPDILKSLASKKENQILVGFAAETEALIENAASKLKSKGLDLIVANDVTQEGAGFDLDTNIAHLIDKKGGVTSLPKMSKEALAGHILQEILKLKSSRS